MSLRRNLFHLALYHASSVLAIGLAYLVVIPIGTRVLSPLEYGVVEGLQTFSGILTIFFSLYVSSAYTRFYYDYRDRPADLARLTSTCIYFLLLLDLLLIVPAYVAGRMFLSGIHVDAGGHIVILAVLLPLSNMLLSLSALSTAYLTQVKDNVAINIVAVGSALVSTALTLACLLGLGQREASFFYAATAANAIGAAYGLYVLRRRGLLKWTFSFPMLKECVKFSGASLPFSLCAWIWNASDQVLLGYYHNVALLAKYALTYKVAMILQLTYGQFWRVANPYLLSYLKDHKAKDERHLLRLLDVYGVILVGGGLGLVFFGQQILRFMAPESYQLDPWILTMCVFAFVCLGIRKYTDSILWFRKKLLTMFVVGGILPAAVNLGLNILLIPVYKEYAAAMSTGVAAMLVLVVSIHMNSRLERIPYRRSQAIRLAAVFAFGVAVNGATILTSTRTLVLDVVVCTVLIAAAVFVVWGRAALPANWAVRSVARS